MIRLVSATITGYRTVTAVRGDGLPQLGTELIALPIPAEIAEPTSVRRAQLDAAGAAADLVAIVKARAIRAQGIVPAVGDRLTLHSVRMAVPAGEMVVTATRQMDGGAELELLLSREADWAPRTGVV